jgi:pantoate--beta-alanine ligase
MTMHRIQHISDIRTLTKNWRASHQSIAFVPTMGNLHPGHLSLVAEAQKRAEKVIVSIFVNPSQFGLNEDFATYPRTEEQDCQLLNAAGVDAVFLPSIDSIYPIDDQTVVNVTRVSQTYCGASRTGHFSGVATVVCKLLNITQPDIALFGLKDFQQFNVIQCLVRDLHLPITLVGVQTMREKDGLAMSSRNQYLSPQERIIAPTLYKTLCWAKDRLIAGCHFKTIENEAIQQLTHTGFDVDYFSIANQHLQPAQSNDQSFIILVAAKLGNTRLIDNINVNF